MPRLLKAETERRVRVSQQALAYAFSLLSIPKPLGYERRSADGAIEIGLIGIAADLAISACVCEVAGLSALIREDSGHYLSAGQMVSEFRKLLASGSPRLSALTHGVADPTGHLRRIDAACQGFPVLFTARAAAVHGGSGTSYDVAFHVGQSVSEFLLLLAESSKWRTYLKHVPAVPPIPKDRRLIADELALRLDDRDSTEIASTLAGIYLVLPELTQQEPEWLEALQRVQVTPRNKDISILIKSLRHAGVGELAKVGPGVDGIATHTEPDNPHALPTYANAMKRKLDLCGRWQAHVGTANGNIDKGILSLPTIDELYDVAERGVGRIGLPQQEVDTGLPAHSVWPFVAAALEYNGIKGPCFFLVKAMRTDAFGQLDHLLRQATRIRGRWEKDLDVYAPVFRAIMDQVAVSPSSTLASYLRDRTDIRKCKREQLLKAIAERSQKAPKDLSGGYEILMSELSATSSVGVLLGRVCQGEICVGDHSTRVSRSLIEAACELADLTTLVSIIRRRREPEYSNLASDARRAIQEIDFLLYGPHMA